MARRPAAKFSRARRTCRAAALKNCQSQLTTRAKNSRPTPFRPFETCRFDYLILPGALTFPFAASLHWPREVAGRSMDTYHRWIELTIPATLAGLPAMSVPVGFNDEGLPMGIQILGPVEKDFSVMQLAHQFDIATGYSRKCPSLSGAVDRGVAGS